MDDWHECQDRIGNPQEQDRRKDYEEEGVVDGINVDKEAREKEKDRYVEECRECVDKFWKVEFYHTFCKERPDPCTIVEPATMILGDKKVATGPLLEKSGQKSAREAHNKAD